MNHHVFIYCSVGVKGIFSFYFEKPENPFFKRKDFILMGLVFMVYDGSLGYGITIIFLMNEPFCWSAKHIGYVRSIFVSPLNFIQ